MNDEQHTYRRDVRAGAKSLASIMQADFRSASIWLHENRDSIGPMTFGCHPDNTWFTSRAVDVAALRDGEPATRKGARRMDQDEAWQSVMGGAL